MSNKAHRTVGRGSKLCSAPISDTYPFWFPLVTLLSHSGTYIHFLPNNPFLPLREKDFRKGQHSLRAEPSCLHLGTIKAVSVLRAFSLETGQTLWSLWEFSSLPTARLPTGKGLRPGEPGKMCLSQHWFLGWRLGMGRPGEEARDRENLLL